MPNNNDVTSKFKVDISDLKKNIQDANRLIRLANAEFKAAAAGMDDWSKSSDGISAKIKQLKSVLTSQETILQNLKEQYKKVAAEQGENSKGAQELAIKIKNQEAAVNKTTAELNKYDKELGNVQEAEKLAAKNGKTVEENLRELGNTAEETGKDVEKSSGGFTVLKGALANLAAQGITMAVSAFKDLTKATWESVKASAAYADEVNTLSKQTGISTEALQEYKYMENLIDVSTETLTGSMAKLTRNMASAQNGSKNTAAAFAALGVSITDSNGELRNNQDVFNEAIDALGKMENETQRDAYAMQIFGKSAQELNPLIEAGGEKLAELAAEAHEAGAVMSQDTLDDLNNVQDGFDRFTATLDATKRNIVAALGPEVLGVVTQFTDIIKKVPEAIKTGDLSPIIDDLGGIFTGFVEKTQKEGPAFVKAGLGIVRQLAEGILQNTPALIDAAGGIALATIEGLEEQLPTFIQSLPPVLQKIAESAIALLPKIINAGNKLIITIIKTITGMLPTLTAALPGFVSTVMTALMAFIPEFLTAGQEILMAIINGLVGAIPGLVEALPQVIDTIMLALQEGLPVILQAAILLFNGIIEALPTIIELLVKALPKVITTATNLLVKSLPLLIDAATQMFMGIIDALPTIIKLLVVNLPLLVTTITMTLIANLPTILLASVQMLTGIVDAIPQICIELVKKVPEIITTIKDGIIEGTKDMLEAGKELVAGVWDGMSNSLGWIKEKITGWVGDVTGFIKNLFGIHSPSTVMRDLIGKNIAAGIAEGIVDNEDLVENAMKSLNADLTHSLNVNGAKAGVVSLSGQMGGQTTQNGNVTKTVNNNFYQYNNSPKALSRLEIYRQTKNQLAFAGGI